MSASDALKWTMTVAIWLVVIMPVVVICGCMVFIVISNHFQARRLGKMMPGLTPPRADNVFDLHKAGHNDLYRWREFGGTLDRPPPPAPFDPKEPA